MGASSRPAAASFGSQGARQNPFVERLSGTIRRDCPEHVVVPNDRHSRRVLRNHLSYYHVWRTHQSLELDAPDGRPIQEWGPGNVIEILESSVLHHHCGRVAA